MQREVERAVSEWRFTRSWIVDDGHHWQRNQADELVDCRQCTEHRTRGDWLWNQVLSGMNDQKPTPQRDPTAPDDRSPSPEAKAPQQPANPGVIPPEHALLTTAEAAAWFKVTERTVEAWRAKRLLPCRKIGRTIRFKLSDLLQALDDRFLIKRRE